MAANEEQDEDDWSRDSIEPERREDGREGPPDEHELPSWFSRDEIDWWWKDPRGGWRRDPCPVRPLGTRDGDYVFVTAFGEIRRFSAGQLHGRGGLPDLFGGSLWWPLKHFRKWDPEKKALTGALQRDRCIAALMRCCILRGFFDDSMQHCSIGTWRGPVVHAGDRIFFNGVVYDPGIELEDALFVVAGTRQAPAHERIGRHGFKWLPASAEDGLTVSTHLGTWAWQTPEARDLVQGSLYCSMLCSALAWLPHLFVQAPFGSGKSLLLKYLRALLGGAAHPVQRTYSKAFIEQHFASMSAALLLDEMESDEQAERIRGLFELIRLLSDDGAEGGRGTSSGKSRKLDVHGTVTMVATASEDWRPQDRSRITLVEMQSFRERGEDHPPAPPEQIETMLKVAVDMSPALRARAIATFESGLFHDNLKIAREAVMKMGGTPRDADQLGHLVAGHRTMTSDDPFDPECHEDITRFRPFIMSLAEEEDGDDEPTILLNLLFGQVSDKWIGGQKPTVGQMIMRARSDEVDAGDWRRALAACGMRLERVQDEPWSKAWLCIANTHVGLDKMLNDHGAKQWAGKKRATMLKELRRKIDGVEWNAKASEGPHSRLRFAGQQSRYLMIPPVFLPSEEDEKQ